MAFINIPEIIGELSDPSFMELRDETSMYYDVFFVDPDEISRQMYAEKIGSYLLELERRNKIRDDDLIKVFMDQIYPLIREKVLPGGRASAYVHRLQELYGTVKYLTNDNSTECLEDYAKISICLLEEIYKKKKAIDDFSLHMEQTDIDDVCELILGTRIRRSIRIPFLKTPAPSIKFPKESEKLVNNLNETVKAVENAKKGFVEEAIAAGKFADKLRKGSNNPEEPIHDKLEQPEKPNLYTNKSFSVLLLRMLYYRICDMEFGME